MNTSNSTSHSNIATEQMTRLGQQIEHESFAVVDQEAGEHAYTAEQWPVVRRMSATTRCRGTMAWLATWWCCTT